MPELCLHCEQAPRQNYLRLCHSCAAQRGVRRLYRKNAKWTPERDARIQAMVEKAKREEPLFAEEEARPISSAMMAQSKDNSDEKTCPLRAAVSARRGG